ncbi:MAG: 23S rRNA (adenine(2030)-N(6))-methyltransferase RlmJ [Alteromonadaceae bacterium]|nr:MAG: 23S rRNA (adenine(2030)-N(6))-methyltransferase RlmJ [Alteromonadaceae bacterium]
MLSYRHSFHAGNFADVIKHLVLVEILEYLTQKDNPFEYIDTHAGGGLFNLGSADAQKLQEHVSGIGKLSPKAFPELSRYFDVVKACNPPGAREADKLNFYPGSPSIAAYFLRTQDRAWLHELHPQDHKKLVKTMAKYKKIRVSCADGFKGLQALLPPVSRRSLVLIDPSYEIKSEYEQAIYAMIKAYKKFATGIYVLWYPVVERSRIDMLEKKLVQSGIKKIQRFELGISPDSDERGMTASGVFVINSPWTLFDRMSSLLPKLAKALGDGGEGSFKCDVISGE